MTGTGKSRGQRGRGREEKERGEDGNIKRRSQREDKEHCDREKTSHLERGGGRDQLCGVRNEKGGKIRKRK